jgi:hypothetical protein
VLILALGVCACAQETASRTVGGTDCAKTDTKETSSDKSCNGDDKKEKSDSEEKDDEKSDSKEKDDEKSDSEDDEPKSLWDRFCKAFSHEKDSDGPISTDRPTFTPACTVVPKGRLQFESGWTFNAERTSQTHATVYDFPELAARYGLTDRVEFRMFWSGETYTDERVPRRRPLRSIDGPGDTEVGFKWQLFTEDKERKWIPTTALITSVIAPTGGSSAYSSETAEPYVNLIYGWNLTEKLLLCGSNGYLGIREQGSPNLLPRTYNLQRWHQSVVAFYTPAERVTLFYEWYILMFTNASDNRPLSYMDSGLLYQLTPNIQLDVRVGFGLSGRPDDFFTGTGFSIRF